VLMLGGGVRCLRCGRWLVRIPL